MCELSGADRFKRMRQLDLNAVDWSRPQKLDKHGRDLHYR